MSYSQGQEQRWILDYFGDRIGTILDIGSNDGKTLSNSLALIERGWGGVLVEPSPRAFARLSELHAERIASGQVEAYQLAIAHVSGELILNESGPHLNESDVALLSSLSSEEVTKWHGTQFIKTPVKAVTWNDFRNLTPRTTFECVSIDAEGFDYWILQQMDLDKMGTELVCVEFNGQNENAFVDYCCQFGLKLRHKNAENLLLCRN